MAAWNIPDVFPWLVQNGFFLSLCWRWIFPTQRLNPGLLHCNQILTVWATRKALNLVYVLARLHACVRMVFVAAHGLSSCGQQGLRLRVWAAYCSGFSSCGAWALGAQASVVVAHGLSCCTACGIFLDQEQNLCPLHCRGILYHWATGKPVIAVYLMQSKNTLVCSFSWYSNSLNLWFIYCFLILNLCFNWRILLYRIVLVSA